MNNAPSRGFTRLALPLTAVCLLLLVFGLRLHHLGTQSLWNDEGSSYVQALRGAADIAANAARDIHPPGYYGLLAGWRLLAGTSEFALRAPSVLASLLAAAFLFAIGRRLFGAGAAGLAVAFTALNSFSIYYAQEARMYALLALCVAALFWALLRLLERPTWARILVCAAITAAGLYTQYAFPFFMLVGGLVVVAALVQMPRTTAPGGSRRRVLLAFSAANLIALALYAPWLPTAVRQISSWPNTGAPIGAGEALATISRWLTFGLTAGEATMAIPFVLLLFGLIDSRRVQPGNTTHSPLRWPLLLPVLWAMVPLGLFLALGLFRPSNLKFLLPAQMGAALWLAHGVMVLWHGARDGLLMPRARSSGIDLGRIVLKLAAAGAASWLIFSQAQLLPPLYGDARYQRADYRAIAARIGSELNAGDIVILDAPNQREVFSYYFDPLNTDGAVAVYELPAGLGGDDAQTRAQMDALLRTHPGGRAYAVFWGEAERDPQRVVETTLDSAAYPADDTWYGDVRLARYALPAQQQTRPTAVTLPLPFTADDGSTLMLERARIVYAPAQGDGLLPGGSLLLSLEWLAREPLAARYSVFVQLLNADGTLALQRDGEPAGGTRPTTTWQAGERVSDHHALLIPRDFPPGTYSLIVGVYPGGAPAARLTLPDGGDALTILEPLVAAVNP